MHADAKREFDKVIRKQRFKTIYLPAAALLAILAGFGVWEMDEWSIGETISGEVLRPPGIVKRINIDVYSFTARLASGKRVAVISDLRVMIAKGSRILVQEEVSRILHRRRYRLIRVEPADNE